MPVDRARTAADVRREIEATERRLRDLHAQWGAEATTANLPPGGVLPEFADRAEAVLRLQRGAVDRLHQLWIEYAQASGLHAP